MIKTLSQTLLLFLLFVAVPWSSQATSILSSPNTSLDDLAAKEHKFLPVEQAFQFSFDQQGDTLKLTWDIAPDYYMYRDKIKFAATDATLGQIEYPPSDSIEDDYFGTSQVYHNQLILTIPLSKVGDKGELKIRYQGCAHAGLCYPPVKQQIPLITSANGAQSNSGTAAPAKNNQPMSVSAPVEELSEQNQLAETLAGGSFLLTLLMFFGLGLGLAFTPCIFPMYPILSGIIAGHSERMSTKYGFMLSLVYVQGMALTYSILGLVVASAGMKFQTYFQSPSVLIGMSLLFVVLALSMFGWFEMALPSKWNNNLTNISNRQKGGSLKGVFVMGALSGLIASPCTTAPLSGVLLYVAKSGDLLTGGLTLYILSLGMGVPLLLLGLSGGKLLPRAGMWMNVVKTTFGFLLLGVPLLLLNRIVDINYIMIAAAALAVSYAAYLYTVSQDVHSAKGKTAMTFVSIALLFASMSTVQQVWLDSAPHQNGAVSSAMAAESESSGFIDIKSLSDLKAQLAIAKAQNKPLMIDLFADWCIACKEFEEKTFSDPTVKRQMAKFRLVRANVTKNDDIDLELLEHFDILGLPTLMFFTPESQELTQQRVTGFMGPQLFDHHLQKVLKR